MPFDEELQRTIDSLTERLCAEIIRELQATGAALAAQAQSERDEAIQAAVREAREHATQTAEAQLNAAVAEARRTAEIHLETAVAEAEARGHTGAQANARAEIAALQQRLQTMANADRDAPGPGRPDDPAASERLLDTVRALDRTQSLSEILDTLAMCAGREAARVAVILARGAELRGWRFIGFSAECEHAAMVIAHDESGVIGEAVRTAAAAPADVSGAASAPRFAALPDGRPCLAVPVIMSGEAVAVLYADQGTGDQSGTRPSSPTWRDAVELMARYAARCLEATTALKAVRVLERSGASPAVSASTAQTEAANADGGGDGARRYARLLVSEIKLYHGAAVAEGQRARDLASRLGIEIARARVLYEQKVPTHLRSERDHFHDELVQTLANGDESLLGQTV